MRNLNQYNLEFSQYQQGFEPETPRKPKRKIRYHIWFYSRKIWFYTKKIYSVIPNPFSMFFKWAVKKLYLKYCFKDSELIEEFVIHFVPENLRGMNPHFFVEKVQSQASKHCWEAKVELLQSGNKISYIRKSSYE